MSVNISETDHKKNLHRKTPSLLRCKRTVFLYFGFFFFNFIFNHVCLTAVKVYYLLVFQFNTNGAL